MSVRVYTDGACSFNGFGGFSAILFIDGAPVDGVYGGAKDTTNNKMELAGLINGMKLLPLVEHLRCKDCGVVAKTCKNDLPMKGVIACPILGTIKRPVYPDATIVSDSQYCVQGASKWLSKWKSNGWKTAQKQPVKNQELWEDVDKLIKQTAANFEWVKGHALDAGNVLADEWAVAGKEKMYGQTHPFWMSKIPVIGD